MGLHDPVTGLPTRRLFLERARQALRLADRREGRVAIVLWRPLGPEEGGAARAGTSHDRTMLETARRLQDNLRSSDLVGRIDEDEFTLLLTGLDDTDALRRALERLARRPSSYGGTRLEGRQLEHRTGAALYPDHGARVEDLLTRARQALEAAAREGREIGIYRRSEIRRAKDEPPEQALPSAPDPEALRSAVEGERFVLAFQPVVRIKDRELEGMEALLQLPRSAGPSAPARSLRASLLEQGLAERADRLSLEGVLRRLPEWTGPRGPSWVSVTVAVELASDAAFRDRLAALLDETGAEARRLVIALTCDDALNHPDPTRTAMRQIAGLGARLALEGVGGGPLPLAPLGERPLHFLKLAPAVVRDLHRQRSRTRLVEALTGLGHAMGAEVMADGVESDGELRRLDGTGCDLAQGFHLGQPRPRDSGN